VALFIMLYNVALPLQSVDETVDVRTNQMKATETLSAVFYTSCNYGIIKDKATLTISESSVALMYQVFILKPSSKGDASKKGCQLNFYFIFNAMITP